MQTSAANLVEKVRAFYDSMIPGYGFTPVVPMEPNGLSLSP
jgi:hypothetical protein